jgi:hypothetical protein
MISKSTLPGTRDKDQRIPHVVFEEKLRGKNPSVFYYLSSSERQMTILPCLRGINLIGSLQVSKNMTSSVPSFTHRHMHPEGHEQWVRAGVDG